jgi:hypothetical protein
MLRSRRAMPRAASDAVFVVCAGRLAFGGLAWRDFPRQMRLTSTRSARSGGRDPPRRWKPLQVRHGLAARARGSPRRPPAHPDGRGARSGGEPRRVCRRAPQRLPTTSRAPVAEVPRASPCASTNWGLTADSRALECGPSGEKWGIVGIHRETPDLQPPSTASGPGRALRYRDFDDGLALRASPSNHSGHG